MSLPPLPGLIPIASFSLKNVNANNLRVVDKKVMGEQRSRRAKSEASDDLIDNAPSSQAPPRSRKTRRKSQRKHDHNKVNPRVNPIFVWVRQENNQIVEVKCEDYDKRNRIVLTKTPQGWRAIPRTETLAPNLKAAVICEQTQEETKPRKSKKSHHRHHKVKRKSTGVQVDDSFEEARESPALDDNYTAENHPKQVEEIQNKCEVTSPLDNLLAVAELEFNQQIQEETKNTTKTLEQEIEETNIEECDYTEEDDIVMNQILLQLEQSLQSPEACNKPSETTVVPEEEREEEEFVEECEREAEYDDQPTDLSMPKPISPRPASRNSIVIQSPQPSGLPPVPPSPDVTKTEPKLPDSEESITSSLPDKKPKPEEDATLRAMLSKDKSSDSKTPSEPSRLLELLMSPEAESPLSQLKRLLTDPNISMPDPLLIPKQRLSAVLNSPGKEIPRLLYYRPELRLPEALKHADLLKNPDILVITVRQLKIILEKKPDIPDDKASKTPEKTIEAHSLRSLLNPTSMMSWLPYLQQLEMAAMTFGNQDFINMLKSNPGGAAFPPGFPVPPPQVLPPSVPPGFPHFYPQHNQFEYPIFQQFAQPSKNHCCVTEKPRPTPKYNPYFNPQHARSNLQVPQYTPTHQRTQKHQKSPKLPAYSQQFDNKSLHRDKCGESALHQTHHYQQSQQPIDLSGVNNVMFKRSKYNNQRFNYCDPPTSAKGSLRFDDTVPEVGSTTASIEDYSALGLGIPDASKNVWHPLFTSPKSSSNPNNWNWTPSVTATGE